MGGLLVFRVGNFDNTAEREQFRFLCEQLKAHYEDSNEFCVLAGNYNIGCELDALFIKKDAIIAIEFKNYGGKLIANENGEWTCDGKVIKGGSRKTVLQQARINHSIVKKELKALGVSKENIKDVPTLIIFNQPVEITNNLSVKKVWVIHIPKHLPKRPVFAHNKAWQRIEDSLVEMTAERMAAILDEPIFSNADWSAQIVPDATIDDLDEVAIAKARKMFKKVHNRIPEAEVNAWNVETFLSKCGIMKNGGIIREQQLRLLGDMLNALSVDKLIYTKGRTWFSNEQL